MMMKSVKCYYGNVALLFQPCSKLIELRRLIRRPSVSIVSNINKRRHISQPLSCALSESKPWRIGGETIAKSIAMACVVGVIGLGVGLGGGRAIAGPREMYQKAPQFEPSRYPLGGRSALESLFEITLCLSSHHLDLEPPASSFPLPSTPSAQQVQGIKMEAVRLMKYGKGEEAVLLLRDAYDVYQYDPEPAYNVDMALVEILISQGKYLEASECNCLKGDQRMPSDARFPLYKAIICTMLDRPYEARKWWDEYVETIEGEFYPTK